jgi:maleate cis-trans isomerase
MPSVGAVRSIKDDTGAPVVSSMQAMFWPGLRLSGITERINRFGRLLMEH